MRIRRFLIGAIGALTLVVGGVARAQDIAPQVQGELDRTDRRIEQAQSLVSGSTRDAVQSELSEAIRIQANARIAFGEARYRMALDLTFRARARADRAIALEKGLPDPDRVLAQLERTRELLDRARDRIESCEVDRARAMLKTALDMQTRAEQTSRNGHYLAALQLTMGARERAHRALRQCNMDEDVAEGADRAMRRTDDALQQAREAVSDHGSDAARRALARANELQEGARRELQERRPEASLRLTLSARAFAFRAIRLSRRRG